MIQGPLVTEFLRISYGKPSFLISLFFMLFNPLLWNIIARLEYNHRAISKLTGGNSKLACYSVALLIFSLGLYRDYLFTRAINDQPRTIWFGTFIGNVLAPLLMICGNALVASSMWQLGIIGTYLGDYFGFLMAEKVTAFPYNVCDHPMYEGATMLFVGYALWKGSVAGLLLAGAAWFAYTIAARVEGPFTAAIYANHARIKASHDKLKST